MTTFLKLILLFLFTVSLAFNRDPVLITVSFIAVFILFLCVKDTNRFQRFKPLFSVSLMVIIFNLVFLPEPNWQSRITKGITSALKLTALSLAVYLFTWTTSISKIINNLIFIPAKLRLMITITFSLIPVIMEEMEKIKLVQTTRGLKPNRFPPFSSIAPIIIPLLVRTLNRAQHLTLILETKNYEQK